MTKHASGPGAKYTKPEIVDYGDLRELTAAELVGTHTDVPKDTMVPFILSTPTLPPP